MRSIIALVAIVILGGAGAAGLARADDKASLMAGFVPHRAVYDLTLVPGREPDKSPVQAGRARLLYEFRGSQCEGWSSSSRLVTELTPQEGNPQISDIRSNTFENAVSREFRFLTSSTVDGTLREEADGSALQDKNGELRISLKKPGKREVSPSGQILFPTEHLTLLLASARAGQNVVEADLFDGSENGDKIYATTAIVGRGRVTSLPEGDPAAIDELRGKPRWPFTVSFFDRAAKGGEQTPLYDLAVEIYENGITRTMSLNYPGFTMKGGLTKLELLPVTPCK